MITIKISAHELSEIIEGYCKELLVEYSDKDYTYVTSLGQYEATIYISRKENEQDDKDVETGSGTTSSM